MVGRIGGKFTEGLDHGRDDFVEISADYLAILEEFRDYVMKLFE